MTQITSTATRLTREYLYVREPFAVSVLASEAGTGKTFTVKFTETAEGDPPAINAELASTTITAAGSPAAYSFSIPVSALVTHLTPFIGRIVYVHIYANDRTVKPFVDGWRVTDTDPDLLPAPR